jgi:hypothetical protein
MIHIYGERHADRIRGSVLSKPFDPSILQNGDLLVLCCQDEEELDMIQEKMQIVPFGVTILLSSVEPEHPDRDKMNTLLEAFTKQNNHLFFNPYVGRQESKYIDIHFYMSVVMFLHNSRFKIGIE